MCVQSGYQSPSIIRRSPRLSRSHASPCSHHAPGHISRRLAFEPDKDATPSAQTQRPIPRSRRMQVHPSAEQISVPASVDIGPYSGANGPSISQRETIDNSIIGSGDHGVRRVQLHPSAQPVSVEASVDPRGGVLSNQPSADLACSSDRQNTLQEFAQSGGAFASQRQASCAQREVQLQSSVEPVHVPRSIDVRPCGVASNDGNNSNERYPGSPAPTSLRNRDTDQPSSPRGAFYDLTNDDDAQNVRVSCSRDVDAVYTFLFRMTVKSLRGLLKEMRLRQSGKKELLLARILIYSDVRLAGGESFTDVMASYHVTSRFESWRHHQKSLDEKVPQYWAVAPSMTDMFSLLDVPEAESFKKKKNDLLRSGEVSVPQNGLQIANASNSGNENGQRANSAAVAAEPRFFSISEFARLCIIIRDDEDAKAAFFSTGQELTRSQMDAGFSRESFWGIIERRFNDPELKLHLNMVGNVEGVDSTLPPPIHRPASFLKEKFLDARSSFTKSVQNWSLSGQNETSNFKSFAGTRDRQLTAAGRRNMVLFVCARMGTDYEDGRFRSMISRVIPNGGGVDEGESMVQGVDDTSHRRTVRPSSRRVSNGNSEAGNDSASRSIVQLSEFIIQRGREKDQQKRSFYEDKREDLLERRKQRQEQHERWREVTAEQQERKKRRPGNYEGLQQLEESHKIIKLLRYATETLKSQGQDPGTELVVATRRHKEALFKALQMPQGTPQGLHCGLPLSDDERDAIRGNRDEHCHGLSRDDPISELRSGEEDQILPN